MNYVLPYCGTCICNGAKLAVAAVARAPPLFIKSFKVISCPTFIHSFYYLEKHFKFCDFHIPQVAPFAGTLC